MKKTKRLFMCALTAAGLAASFAAPVASNAIYYVQDSNSSAFDFLNNEERYVKLDGKYKEFFNLLGSSYLSDEQLEKADVYAHKTGRSIFKVVPVKMGNEEGGVSAVFNLTEGTTEEQVDEFLHKKFNSYYGISRYDCNSDYKYQFACSYRYFEEVCKLLKEENFIDSFVIPGGYFQLLEYGTVGEGNLFYYYLSNDEYEAVNEYITENELGSLTLRSEGLTLRLEGKGKSSYCFYNDSLEATEDILDAAIAIYEATGAYPSYISPASNDTMQAGSIDVFNAVDGDANCDGELTIADATLILQHLGNADKYSLSAQGEFNADVTGDYDGISAADALAIQMLETGVIDEFN